MNARKIVEMAETYPTKRERVFAAFSEAAALERWLGPSDEFRTRVLEFDFRPGGSYRIEFNSPEGQTSILTGQYTKIIEPELIVFSWRWLESDEFPDMETRVTVSLVSTADGQATELRLVHEELLEGVMLERHMWGWTGALARLEREST